MKLFIKLFLFAYVITGLAFAQKDTLLKTYFVRSKLDEECHAEISVVLFDKALKQDKINGQILNALMKGYYDTGQSVSLSNLYQMKSLPPSGEMLFTIGGTCSFSRRGIYSFIACPYNVCDKTARSNFESNTITVDFTTGKELGLYDIIDPLKKDTFEKYIYTTAKRYHIRNIPSCYFSSLNPLQVTGSNNVFTRGDTVEYTLGLTGKFYLSGDRIFVFTKATHRDYNYNSVEVAIPLFYARYYLRKELIERFDL